MNQGLNEQFCNLKPLYQSQWIISLYCSIDYESMLRIDALIRRYMYEQNMFCNTVLFFPPDVLDNSDQLCSRYRTEAVKLRDHYYAIEIDPSLTKEQKYPYMVEW